MHKFMLKMFEFSKNFIQFLKIVSLFFVMLTILYWIENLTGFNWNWIRIFTPILDVFVYIGSLFFNNSYEIFNAAFEFKYIGAIIFLLICYFACNGLNTITEKFEEFYCDTRRCIKKLEEDNFNRQIANEQEKEQKQLKNFVVYVSARIKKNYDNKNFNISLDEHNKKMNKFLIAETLVSPEIYGKGYLYKFSNFENIDKLLAVFFKLLEKNTQFDFVIAVQVYGRNFETEKLDKLIDLDLTNKITMFADTAYRYKFNEIKSYSIEQIGLFQKGENTLEALYFERK